MIIDTWNLSEAASYESRFVFNEYAVFEFAAEYPARGNDISVRWRWTRNSFEYAETADVIDLVVHRGDPLVHNRSHECVGGDFVGFGRNDGSTISNAPGASIAPCPTNPERETRAGKSGAGAVSARGPMAAVVREGSNDLGFGSLDVPLDVGDESWVS
jgi:hypothetical protein